MFISILLFLMSQVGPTPIAGLNGVTTAAFLRQNNAPVAVANFRGR